MIDPVHLLAVFLALGAALASAAVSIFVRMGTNRGSVNDAVFIVMIVNLIVLLPLVVIFYYPNYGLTRLSVVSFIAAGISGTVLGRLLKYTSIERIGASRTEPIVASWVLVATILGVLFLGETVLVIHGFGIILIVIGVALITWEMSHDDHENRSQRTIVISLVLPFTAAFVFGLEPIFAMFGLDEGTPAAVGLVIKTGAATLGFTLYLRWKKTIPTRSVIRASNSRWFILAGIASTLFLLGYYIGLSIAPVNVIVPIIATNTLFVVLISAILLPRQLEYVTFRLVTAAIVVVLGVIMVTVYG